MAPPPRNMTNSWSSVECHGTSIADQRAMLHEDGCTSAQWDMSAPISVIRHGDAPTNATNIMPLYFESSSVGEHSYKQSKEALGPMPDFPCTCLPVQDEMPLQHGFESGVDNDEDQAGNFSSGTKISDTAAAKRIYQQHHVRTTDAKYRCVTQRHACAEVRIGWDGEIPRWRRGSELSYVVCEESFPAPLSSLVGEAMRKATGMWKGIGVSFKEVRRDNPATFAVMFENRNSRNAYACSFFPNESSRELIVYPSTLREPGCLANILAHEVGHILGLRHEFAYKREKGYPSVLLGSENAQSVMNYFEHPEQLQVKQQDLEELERFYAYDQAEYEELPILDIDPETCTFLTHSDSRPVSSVNSAAIDKKQISIYPNLYWLNVDTAMQHRPDILSLVFFMLFMILTMFILILFLLLYLAGFSFLLC